MLSFRAFLTEAAAVAKTTILQIISSAGVKPANAKGIQFILPNGGGVVLDDRSTHARAVHERAVESHADFRLIDVMQAGIVRKAGMGRFQVCSPITSAQAQAMYDVATTDSGMRKAETMIVSVADGYMAHEDDGTNNGVGPIEINDAAWKEFDLDRVKPVTLRTWVNAQHFAS